LQVLLDGGTPTSRNDWEGDHNVDLPARA